eukprot:768813-Hanusia_phi.AAC.8
MRRIKDVSKNWRRSISRLSVENGTYWDEGAHRDVDVEEVDEKAAEKELRRKKREAELEAKKHRKARRRAKSITPQPKFQTGEEASDAGMQSLSTSTMRIRYRRCKEGRHLLGSMRRNLSGEFVQNRKFCRRAGSDWKGGALRGRSTEWRKVKKILRRKEPEVSVQTDPGPQPPTPAAARKRWLNVCCVALWLQCEKCLQRARSSLGNVLSDLSSEISNLASKLTSSASSGADQKSEETKEDTEIKRNAEEEERVVELKREASVKKPTSKFQRQPSDDLNVSPDNSEDEIQLVYHHIQPEEQKITTNYKTTSGALRNNKVDFTAFERYASVVSERETLSRVNRAGSR